ncbi:MAG TPA: ABC transporter permease [Lachnospiraceae bacterium]|nr:ABC transporter permease [Lachnospiraceae bacterium]
MFSKLALRNVKRQFGNYVIYFITVTLTVAMMFALCNLIFSEQLLGYAKKMEELQDGLIGITVAVSLIVAFVLGYASSFMLKLRKREFGTYLTLGMTRRNILIMFTVENLLIGAVALGSGILLGLVFFQGIMGLVARVLEIKIALAKYSMPGLLLTIGLTVFMFLLSTVSSALYLKRVSIQELIHADKKVDRPVKHPVIWLSITILSFVSIIVSIFGSYHALRDMFLTNASDTSSSTKLFGYLTLLTIAVVFYHIGFSKSVIHLLLKIDRLKCSGTNIFVLRQLSGQLSANSVLCGIIAFLIAATVLCTNVSFGQKATSKQYLDQSFPFDITANLTDNKDAPYSSEEAIRYIEKYATIKKMLPYIIYTSGNGDLHTFTPWSGEQYEHLYDSFIKESDFNRLITELGYEPVSLKNSFLILVSSANINKCNFSNATLSVKGTKYNLKEVTDRYPNLARCYFLTVVPDEAVSGLEVETKQVAFDLDDNGYDAQAFYDELSYTIPTEQGYQIERCNYSIRAYYELEENSLTAILIVGELYMSIVFVFMAVAILTMKLLSGLPEDRNRYDLLYKLGVSREEQKKALLRQTISLFTVPFFLPVLLSIPSAFICGQIVKLGGYHTFNIYNLA